MLRLTGIAIIVLLATATGSAPMAATGLLAQHCAMATCFPLESTIAFSSTRESSTAEVYLMKPDGTDARRLTTDNAWGDGFASLSPDGKQIVFDSARLSGAVNDTDLFVMEGDGSGQLFLARGSSATWSPDSRYIAFHASVSGTGTPIRDDPGSATSDSDVFVANVDDLLAGVEQPRNITNSAGAIDDDADWSPDGERLVFTRHAVDDPNHNNPTSAEVYAVNADGTDLQQLTSNVEEERAPAWSPDGTRIVFSCRRGGPDFELCVMNADGTGQVQLTSNSVADLTATWAPDGQRIVFHRPVPGQGNQLFTMTPALNPDGTLPAAAQLTSPPGLNLLANWGELRVKG